MTDDLVLERSLQRLKKATAALRGIEILDLNRQEEFAAAWEARNEINKAGEYVRELLTRKRRHLKRKKS